MLHEHHRQPHVDIDWKEMLAKPLQHAITNTALHSEQNYQRSENNAQQIITESEAIVGMTKKQNKCYRHQ